MLPTDKIFLIGFMGSGKTTLAKKLATKLSMPFFDLDLEIESGENLSVDQIFEQKGEAYFRAIEKAVLGEINAKENGFIMSVGGGAPCFFDNMKLINNSGTSIYLKYNVGILSSRLINAKVIRPLIKGLNEIELKTFIANKLNERERFYKQSKFVVEKDIVKIEDLISLFQ